jgi:predicted transcriptional regulator
VTDRTITLRSDLVERLETLAERQGRSLDDVFGELLNTYAPVARREEIAALAHQCLDVASSHPESLPALDA